MSCYLLLQGITKNLTGVVSWYWWSTKRNNKGLHWVAWDNICVPLECGGLGFRDFRDFNISLLAKQFWLLLKYTHSLLARVLKGWYYRHSNPLNIGAVSNPSNGWESIIAASPILQHELRKTIGNGFDTYVWEDLWLLTTPARPANGNGLNCDPNLSVHHLIDYDTQTWNLEMLHEFVDVFSRYASVRQDEGIVSVGTILSPDYIRWNLATTRPWLR